MYNNQFFASTIFLKNKFNGFNRINLGDIYFNLSHSLRYEYAENNGVEILLLGYIINPFAPSDSDKKTVEHLTKYCKTKYEFLKEINNYSGRFVILYKNKNSFVLCCDAVNFRQVYYNFDNEQTVLTSNIKMYMDYFETSLQISSDKLELLNSKIFKKREHAWFGENSYDDRLNKLLPNHYLDLLDRKVSRLPYYKKDSLKTEGDYLQYTAEVLRGTYDYLINHYNLIQPLTSGLDSRALLAASKKYMNRIKYYLFDKNNDPNVSDIIIPTQLSKILDFEFNVYPRKPLTDEFLNKFKDEHSIPRILSKTANIQHHYYNLNGVNNILSVSGVVGEVVRSFYGYTKNKNVSTNLLYEFSGYAGSSKYVYDCIDDWLSKARIYADEYELSLLDLFYWEQRLGNWGAVYPFEQDIAIEENSPFNNRLLLMNLHKISYKQRRAPKYDFFVKLINYMWKDVLSQPINPDRSKLVDYLKERSRIRYYVLKTRRLIKL